MMSGSIGAGWAQCQLDDRPPTRPSTKNMMGAEATCADTHEKMS